MTCNICGVNESTIHLTEIINNQMIEVHLCESCAQEKGTDFKTHFSFGDLLAGLSDVDKGLLSSISEEDSTCSACGETYEDFTKSGRLGCASCYVAFSKLLSPLIKRVQRSTNHIGKKPSRIPRDLRSSHDLRLSQDRLAKAIQAEDFEEAARVRDEIKKIQEKLEKLHKSKKASGE